MGVCVINIFILPHADSTRSYQQLVFWVLCNRTESRPRPAIRYGTFRPHKSRRHNGAPYLLYPCSPKKKKGKERRANQGRTKELNILMRDRPSSFSASTGSASSAPLAPPSASRETKLPTFVSRGKVSTTGVALSSSKSVPIRGALGCPHPQAFPTLLHIVLIWGAQAPHLTKG